MATTFHVDGMHCDACARRVTAAVVKVAPGAKVAIDLATGKVTVTASPDPAPITAAIVKAGYKVLAVG
jgi:copper chaperone CopZ